MKILKENNLITDNPDKSREVQKIAEILWNLIRYFYDKKHIYTRSYYGLSAKDIFCIKVNYNNLLEGSKVLTRYLNRKLVSSDTYHKVLPTCHSSTKEYQILFDMCIKLESLVNIKEFLNNQYHNCNFNLKEGANVDVEFRKIISNILKKLIGYTKNESKEELNNKTSFTDFYKNYIETNLKTFGYWPKALDNQTFARLPKRTKKDMLITSAKFNTALNNLHAFFPNKNKKELIKMPSEFCKGCSMPIKDESQHILTRYKRYIA